MGQDLVEIVGNGLRDELDAFTGRMNIVVGVDVAQDGLTLGVEGLGVDVD